MKVYCSCFLLQILLVAYTLGRKGNAKCGQICERNKVRIGAHPSFPDRENFGRTAMALSSQELIAHLRYQLGALKAICDGEGR